MVLFVGTILAARSFVEDFDDEDWLEEFGDEEDEEDTLSYYLTYSFDLVALQKSVKGLEQLNEDSD